MSFRLTILRIIVFIVIFFTTTPLFGQCSSELESYINRYNDNPQGRIQLMQEFCRDVNNIRWNNKNIECALKYLMLRYVNEYDVEAWPKVEECLYKMINTRNILFIEDVIENYQFPEPEEKLRAINKYDKLRRRWYSPTSADILLRCGNKIKDNYYHVYLNVCRKQLVRTDNAIPIEVKYWNDRLVELKYDQIFEYQKLLKIDSPDGLSVDDLKMDGSTVYLSPSDNPRQIVISYDGTQIGTVTIEIKGDSNIVWDIHPLIGSKKLNIVGNDYTPGNISSRSWAIDGEEITKTQNFKYEFNKVGNYVISLELINDQGDGRIAKKIVTVTHWSPRLWRWGSTALFVGCFVGEIISKEDKYNKWDTYFLDRTDESYTTYEDAYNMNKYWRYGLGISAAATVTFWTWHWLNEGFHMGWWPSFFGGPVYKDGRNTKLMNERELLKSQMEEQDRISTTITPSRFELVVHFN